jgi:chemotaxis protein MotB
MGEQKVVIKKVKKVVHGGGHGGSSWKVAYADFVTALMAFFLLLWLISMVSPEKRARVAQYFNTFSVFDRTGASILQGQNQAVVNLGNWEKHPDSGHSNEINDGNKIDAMRVKFVETLKQEIETKLADIENHILIQDAPNGVRVEIVDLNDSPIFAVGSSRMTDAGRRILAVVARTLTQTKHPIAIEGHTDARVYSSVHYSNWELSTERASAARIVLQEDGLPPNLLLRVVGYAATQPLVQSDPMDPRNRRISIMVYNGAPQHS